MPDHTFILPPWKDVNATFAQPISEICRRHESGMLTLETSITMVESIIDRCRGEHAARLALCVTSGVIGAAIARRYNISEAVRRTDSETARLDPSVRRDDCWLNHLELFVADGARGSYPCLASPATRN